MNNSDPLTVTQFCTFVKDILPGKKFLVTGEVNQLKNSHSVLLPRQALLLEPNCTQKYQ